jgi:hypothetical protein
MTRRWHGRLPSRIGLVAVLFAACKGADPGLPPQAAAPSPQASSALSEPSAADPDVAAAV